MNIADASALRACTSCQMCAAVCPKDAIGIHLDEEGFYRPRVDADRCVDCGLCVKVCYKYDDAVRETSAEALAAMPLYAAVAKADGLLPQVTSGGVADILAKSFIAQGYTCVGVGYDDNQARAYHYCTRSAEETEGFRGSKYIQSYSFSAFKHLVQNCRKERFAVFGTPCQIYAAHRFLEQRRLRDNCILVDLYCHGCPSLHAWTKYQTNIKGLTGKARFDHVSFRSKVKGWGNFYVVVVVDGQQVFISSPKKDEFYTLFFSDLVLNEACADCRLRSTMAYTDIRLGDFWGKRYIKNTSGMSAVSLATPQGQSAFAAIVPQLQTKAHSYADFLPWQSYGKTYRPNAAARKRLLAQLADPNVPLGETVRQYYHMQSLKARIKRYVKHVLYYMPSWVVVRVKAFVA